MFWFLKCHALLVLFMLSRYGNCKVFKRVRNKVVRFFSMVKWSNTCITIVTEVPSTSETVIVTIEEPVTKKRCKVESESVPTFLEQMVNSSPSQQTKNIEKKNKQQSSRKYSWKRDNLRGENLSWKNVPPSGTDALKEIIYDGVNNETVTVCSYRFRWKLTVSHNW